MSKRINKILWHGTIVPEAASKHGALDGLNRGELFIYEDDDSPALYIQTESGAIKKIGSVDLDTLKGIFLRKDISDRSAGKVSADEGFEGGEFNEGATGAGVYKDKDGNWHIEADFLKARRKLIASEVEIETSHHVGGQQLLTAAGCTVDYVLEKEDVYRCYFLKVDPTTGKQVTNRWKPNDQAYCNTFNLADNEGSAASHYYWRLVTATSNETADELTEVEFDDAVIQTANYHFIDLSKTVCGAESDAPQALDDVVQLGYQGTDDASRQNAIIMAGAGEGSPYIYEFVGINTFYMPEPEIKLKPGDNVLSGVVRFQQGSTGWQNMEGLPEEIQQAAQFGKDAQDTANSALDAANSAVTKVETMETNYNTLTEYVDSIADGLQNQIDGSIDSYFQDYEPTTTNYPATEWDTDLLKEAHLNDTFTNLTDGRSWRWSVSNGVYSWVEITDTATSKALALAGEAQETADGKMTVFINQPTPPYQAGDLWAAGEDAPLKRCIVSRESGSYVESDWALADNSQAYADAVKAELEQSVADTKQSLDETKGALEQAIKDLESSSAEYTDEAKAALEESIKTLEVAKANVADVYDKSKVDGKITAAEQDAIDAAQNLADAAKASAKAYTEAYADGKITESETKVLEQVDADLQAAKEEMAKYTDDVFGSLEYGKNNLLRNTGFTGDYVTAELTGGSSLKDTSEMYSPSLKYWEATYATAQESDVSESGKEVSILSGGSLQQTLFYKIVADESYVFSWRGKGGTVTFIVGGMTFATVMTDTWAKYDVKFKAASEGTIFSLSVSGDSVLCELQLERGTVRSAWGICPLDNRSELAKYESLTYLQNLLKGETMVNGAVLSTGQILMGHYDEEGNYTKTTAGVSGVYNDDHSAAFWAGGNWEDAIFTIATYLDNPSYQPTEEELAKMAKCVITHGGRAILNDIILRGYIYALGGYFKGEVNAEKGVFKNIASPNDGFKIDEAGNAEFTSGTIGSFDIIGGYLGLKSEGANGLDTASKMALTSDSIIFNESPRQVIIGTSRQYAYHYLGKFQDTRENTTAHNVGLEFNIQNSVLGNHAFKGIGSGSLNGVICGYAVQNISWSQENEYKGIDMKLGNHIVARCSYSGAKLVLPTRGSVCDALGIGADEEFAVPLTIVTSASTSGYTIYGRTPEIAELSGEAFPILYGNNYNQELGVLTTQGDTRHYLLTYTNGVYEAFTIGYRD